MHTSADARPPRPNLVPRRPAARRSRAACETDGVKTGPWVVRLVFTPSVPHPTRPLSRPVAGRRRRHQSAASAD